MTSEEFDALEVGQKIYRCNEGELQSYRITHKTPFTCDIDRPCLLTLSRAVSGDRNKMLKKTAQTYFWISGLGAIHAEHTRVQELFNYHLNEATKAFQALAAALLGLEKLRENENCGE